MGNNMFLPVGYGIDFTPIVNLIKESEDRIMATVKEALAELKSVVAAEKAEVLTKIAELESKLEDALEDTSPELVDEINAIIEDVKGIVTTPVIVLPVDETPVEPPSDAPQIG
jgi:hypothetical protein